MTRMKKRIGRILTVLLTMALVLSMAPAEALAAESGTAEAGTYSVSVDLTAAVSAMNMDFGDVLSDTAVLVIDESGNYDITLSFATASVMNGAAEIFVDPTSYAPGYYDADGTLQTAEYTTSSSTAQNPDGTAVNYVDSMTFTLPDTSGSYYLYVYINSSVMGCLFGGTQENYQAVLSVLLPEVSGDDEDASDDDSTGSDSSDDTSSDDTLSDDDSSTEGGTLSAGTYEVDGALSAYVSAMGGIEFGAPLLESLTLVVDENGDYYITLNLTAAQIEVYGVTATVFADASSSSPAYYDAAGNKYSAGYTLSSSTASDSSGNAVNYVDSITFKLPDTSGSYYLYLYVNSDVMGQQFGNTSEKYQAILTLDLNSAVLVSEDTDVDTSSPAATSTDASDDEEDEDADTETADTTEYAYGLEPGTYTPSGSLSAYISAMGGVEFGSVYNGLQVVVNEDGTYTITVYFKTSSVDIYSLTVDTFADASDSTPGYYDSDGTLHYASYTLSSDTATDADGNEVHYVTSMTFTVSELSSYYYLWIYINSSVMGVQFGNGTGSGTSNQPGVSTPYKALLTIDWSSIGATGVSDSSPETAEGSRMTFLIMLAVLSAAGMVCSRRKMKIRA